jgi:two-component system, NtrC family, response regulator GlrR
VSQSTPPEGPNDRTPGATQVVMMEGRSHVLVRRFRLQVVSGPDAGMSFVSSGERTTIGTHGSCQMVLHDPTVSRFHCEIVIEGDRLVVRDLDSRNGTVVDGVTIGAAFPNRASTLTLGHSQLRLDFGEDRAPIPLSKNERFGLLLGRSVAMRAIFALLERAAESDATVLLTGETGTGKELAAESIHHEGARREGPFVVVDCGSIPSELLESELFGHERGAFTGATQARQGAFEEASGGTIFLDEVGELGLDLQPKILRALESREIKRVGRNKYTPIDVRVIAATNRNLRNEVNAQRFRADLYYRLAVLQVAIPPLRSRVEDLPVLVEALLSSMDPEAVVTLVTPAFLSEIARHAWPGNVRELRNYLERCLAMRETLPLTEETGEPPAHVDISRPLREVKEAAVRMIERRYVEELLRQSGGSVSAAARAAGVSRIYFYRLVRRYGLRGVPT